MRATPPLPETAGRGYRLDSIDVLRGLVMFVMALDHARDFFSGARFNPVDLSSTTPAYFATRWITHFAAPVFAFTAGVAAYLSSARRTTRELSRFLWTRGLWLVLLEFTVVGLAWRFSFDGSFTAQVIWILGVSMIALAALVHLPSRWVGGVGVAMIALHHLADPIRAASLGGFEPLWLLLHQQGWIRFPNGWGVFVSYPLIPWVGVMAAGYGFAELFRRDSARRNRLFVRVGLGLVVAFLLIRLLNFYGDPRPWAEHPRGDVFTLIAFMNVEKYPPSLLFLLATLGPAIALLPALERASGPLSRFFVTLGRVPLFYYVVHIYALHALALAFSLLTAVEPSRLLVIPFDDRWPTPFGWGLPIVYAVWIGVVLALYPACAWFADLKRRRRDWWLSYL